MTTNNLALAGDPRYCVLPIDTKVFGFPVVRIIPETLEHGELGDLLAILRSVGVRLVFWGAHDASSVSHREAADQGGFLAARNARYCMKLNIRTVSSRAQPHGVKADAEGVPQGELVSLALEAGLTSRYRRDSRIGPARTDHLYREWMLHALANPSECRVFTMRHGAMTAGMAVATSGPDHAVIMLLAVHEALRGQGHGQSLVRGIQRHYCDERIPTLAVITPADNRAACRLYKSCGFRRDAFLAMYHFWL